MQAAEGEGGDLRGRRRQRAAAALAAALGAPDEGGRLPLGRPARHGAPGPGVTLQADEGMQLLRAMLCCLAAPACLAPAGAPNLSSR